MTEKISILGSTGSIGTQALQVAEKRNIKVVSLAAGSNVKLMERQIRKFKPDFAAMADEKAASELRTLVADTNTKIFSGAEGVCECAAAKDADTVLNSLVGIAGLMPTLTAIDEKKNIALANKETLVAGGALVTKRAREKGVKILPVDSEHSAIFQCLEGMNKKSELKSIILTASGGPFFSKKRKDLENVTVKEALNHPNWSMGAKITVDSASMMNKGLELIEAVWLFDVKPDMIDIVIHRESVVHSLVEYRDNSVIAQLGVPDMRIPIQYALTYPERYESPTGKLSLSKYGNLSFFEMDSETFICPSLCRKAIEKGGLYPAIVNGANEKANELFRQGKIGFLEIADCVSFALENGASKEDYNLSDVLEADKNARLTVESHIL